jgi:tryptophan synthase alpha chain
MTTPLAQLFEKTKSENRAALIAYIPAGFPTQEGCKAVIDAFADAGVDAIEIGFPYSDPVMDGPTIQEAADISLKSGTGAKEVFDALAHATSRGIPSVVMTYWNPIEKYGVQDFAASISANNGSGVITPDLPVDEAQQWKSACATSDINSIFVVAPSTTDARLERVTSHCSGFVYAASLMGVTGARTGISSGAKDLVDRIRRVTKTPVAVGLGVSTREHAKEVAAYADGVIVGSAFINAISGANSLESGIKAVRTLVEQLALGVREGR